MNTFFRRAVLASLLALSAATLAGPTTADARIPMDDAIVSRPAPSSDCTKNGGTPEQCATVKNPTWAPRAGEGPPKRILRITNVRGNASALGVSSTLIPAQIVAF